MPATVSPFAFSALRERVLFSLFWEVRVKAVCIRELSDYWKQFAKHCLLCALFVTDQRHERALIASISHRTLQVLSGSAFGDGECLSIRCGGMWPARQSVVG